MCRSAGGQGQDGSENPTTVAQGGNAGSSASAGGNGAGTATNGNTIAATRGGDLGSVLTSGAGGGGGGNGRIGVDVAVCGNVAVTRFAPRPNCI